MDDEIALQVLLHCRMKIESALVKFRQLPVKTICKSISPIKEPRFTLVDSYREWLPDEIQRFEEGVQEYGKDFFKIIMDKVILGFSIDQSSTNNSSVLIELFEK